MNYLLYSCGGKLSEVTPTNTLHLYKVVKSSCHAQSQHDDIAHVNTINVIVSVRSIRL